MQRAFLLAYQRIRFPVLSVYRAVVGLLFACHGAATLFNIPAGAAYGARPAFGSWPGWYAAVIELVGGLLVMVGAGTRLAAVACSGTMAYAYFSVHQSHALWPIQNGGEPAVMFCWGFLAVALIGPGPLSVDALVARLRRTVRAADESVVAPEAAR